MTGASSGDKPAKDQQVVFLVGPSHNGEDGGKRTVSTEQAVSLVERGLARYPKNHQG